MTDNLKTAGQKRRSTKRKSIADLEITPTDLIPTKVSDHNLTVPKETLFQIPGNFDVNNVTSSLPSVDLSKYQVDDPLNPPETLPTISQYAFDKGMAIYQGAIRNLQMQGANTDLVNEKFKVLGKQAKAAVSVINAATDYKKAEAAHYDYLNQTEINTQKADNLELQTHRTVNNKTQIGYDKKISDEKLEQSRITSELLSGKTMQKQAELDELMKQINPKISKSI